MSKRYLLLAPVLTLISLGACSPVPEAPPTPTALQLVLGGGQTGTPGYRLTDEVVVKLVDDRGAPVVGATVSFSSDDPDGLPEPVSGITGTDGTVRTWWRLGGTLGSQQLTARADILPIDALQIVASARSSTVRSLSTTTHGTCVVANSGVLSCMSAPIRGQPNPIALPTIVGAGTRFTEVVVVDFQNSVSYGCASTEAGRIWCFTMRSGAQISAVSELAGTYPPLSRLTGAGGAAPGSFCGLTADGQGYCWGAKRSSGNNLGIQSGDGSSPAPLWSDERFVSIVMGVDNGCALKATGEAFCWGRNVHGQVGVAVGGNAPTPVATTVRFSKLELGDWDETACGIATAGGLYCWGSGRGMLPAGELGYVPQAIPGRTATLNLVQIGYLFLALDQGGTGALWGLLPPGGSSFPPFASLARRFLVRDQINRGGTELSCGHALTSDAVLCQSLRSLIGDHSIYDTLPPVIGVP